MAIVFTSLGFVKSIKILQIRTRYEFEAEIDERQVGKLTSKI
jgi:hypothetical protein